MCLQFFPGEGHALPAAVNLSSDAKLASQLGGPLIVLYSRDDCPYCRIVKRNYLQPLLSEPRYQKRVIVREINVDSESTLIDFDGQKTTHSKFAEREKIRFVPVVSFYGPKGLTLAEPIVGSRLPDFYQSYLDDAIKQSILFGKASGVVQFPQ
jgi:thioredoxin-related protein